MLPFLFKTLPARINVNITAALKTEGAAPAISVNSHITDKIKIGSIHLLALEDLNKEKNNTNVL
jgi:hypothetical protein